ncbi:MAG: LamG domain-containing protein [Nitrososphaeraceae archaeon]
MDTDQSDFCYEATYDDNGNMCWYVRYNSVDYRLYAPGAFPDYNVIFPDFDIEEFDGDDYDTSYNEPRWGGVINPFDPSKVTLSDFVFAFNFTTHELKVFRDGDELSHSQNSLNFTRANNTSVTVPYNAAFDNFTALTVSCWVKRKSITGSYASYVHKGYPSAGWFDLQDNPSGYLYFNAGGAIMPQTVSYTNNVWHHFAGVWTGSTISLYVDGVLVKGPISATAAPTSLNAPLDIGSLVGTSQFVDANIADVRIYNVGLTNSEVSNLYAGQDVTRGLLDCISLLLRQRSIFHHGGQVQHLERQKGLHFVPLPYLIFFQQEQKGTRAQNPQKF